MISKELRDVYLVDELQLGERLNKSLQEGDQTDFSLMLALLSPDVTDAAWTRGPDEGQAPEDNPEVGRSQVFLAECLRPEPLTPFKRDLAPEVYAEFSPLKKEKVRKQFAGEVIQYQTLQGSKQDLEVLDEIKQSKIQIDV